MKTMTMDCRPSTIGENCTGLTSMLLLFLLIACGPKKETTVQETHEIEIKKPGEGMIYLDKIDCKAVVQEVDSAGSETIFHCFRVGFTDSLELAKPTNKQTMATNIYYQYNMQEDWVMLINADSVKPVFYQPRQKLERHRFEAILVFEVPKYKTTDTLIYTDSYGAWSIQKMILKQ
jgi:hypothetical protein